MKFNNKNNKIVLNGTTYLPHTICDLPNNFGFHDKEPIPHLRTKDSRVSSTKASKASVPQAASNTASR